MINILKKYKNVISQAIPSLIAICLVETVNVEVYLSGPILKSSWMLFLWITLQMIPGFLFGYISDCNFRKNALIASQLLGFLGGTILAIFGFEIWVLILIALTFNPLPVARAALLDHFPHHSTVKLVAITFLAQNLPWAFFSFFAKIPYQIVVYFILGLIGVNTLLTIFLFKNDSDVLIKKEVQPKSVIIRKNEGFIYTLSAFILAEATFYLLWAFLEYDAAGPSWISITTSTTLLGIFITMFYTRLPHISIITLFYSIGAGITFVAFTHCFFYNSLCNNSLVTSMSYYAIIGGLYLPFVTDGIIKILGPRRKAFGSATIEFGDTLASFFAPLLNIFLKESSFGILIVIVCLYLLATILQRRGEKVLIIHR